MVSHVTVHIASHYRRDREPVLETVLDGLLGWTNAILDVTVTSNVPTYEDTGFIARKAAAFAEQGSTLRLEVADDLPNPRLLTWAHKRHLPSWAAAAQPEEDFFLYIEDDVRLTDENFVYFRMHLKTLRPHGLIPGFLRYETPFEAGGDPVLVDLVHPEYWQRDRSRRIDGTFYHAMINPYWAGFMLDRDLAREYVSSRSFDLEGSEAVHAWHVQERAAMGLAYEAPPRGLRTRRVIPLADGRPDPGALVWHCTDTYTRMGHPQLGRMTEADIFRRESTPQYLRRKAGRALTRLGIGR